MMQMSFAAEVHSLKRDHNENLEQLGPMVKHQRSQLGVLMQQELELSGIQTEFSLFRIPRFPFG